MSDVPSHKHSLRIRPNLPPEIISDILSRLPVKSLHRFKCVSPSWNSLISSPDFAKTHFQSHLTKPTYNPKQHFSHNIVISSTPLYSINLAADASPTATKLHLPSLQLQPPFNNWVYPLGSCHSLLLFCHRDRSTFFLLNPSTQQCKNLPHLPFIYDPGYGMYTCLYGVGYDPSTDDYKVVMLFYLPNPDPSDESDDESESEGGGYSSTSYLTDSTHVVVYSVKDNAWRQIQDTQRVPEANSYGVYFNGFLYWVCWRAGSYVILAFDLADEIFREVPLPLPAPFGSLFADDRTNYEMVVVGDSLCLVYKPSGSQIEVWEMKESVGEQVSWSKTIVVDVSIMTDVNETSLLGLLAENEFVLMIKRKWFPGGGVPTNEVVVYNSQTAPPDKLVVYNRQTGTLRDIFVGGIPNKFRFCGTYAESLLPCLS